MVHKNAASQKCRNQWEFKMIKIIVRLPIASKFPQAFLSAQYAFENASVSNVPLNNGLSGIIMQRMIK